MPDFFDLERFVAAQQPVFDTVLKELAAGRKCSHWMWFIFPQLRGLGHSSMAQFYGISGLAEAKAYLIHPILGPRLVLCVETMQASGEHSLHTILGSPDDMKFRSSMTLFSFASAEKENSFQQALNQWCGGQSDCQTLALLDGN